MKEEESRGSPTPTPPEFDWEKVTKYLINRSEEFQRQENWESSFECLYFITVINRGWYWDKNGKRISITPGSPSGAEPLDKTKT